MERLVDVNLMGTIYWTKALLPQMVERRRGSATLPRLVREEEKALG